jgi:hypothetical protein
MIANSETTKNTRADQWINLDDVWSVIVAVSVRCDHALDNARMTAASAFILLVTDHSQIANRAQAMAAAPAASPSLLAKAYAVAVDSRKMKARKTNALVQRPALCLCASTPKASNALRTMRTTVPGESAVRASRQGTYNRGRERTGGGQTPLRPESHPCAWSIR